MRKCRIVFALSCLLLLLALGVPARRDAGRGPAAQGAASTRVAPTDAAPSPPAPPGVARTDVTSPPSSPPGGSVAGSGEADPFPVAVGALLLEDRGALLDRIRSAPSSADRGAALYALIAGPGLRVEDFTVLEELLYRETDADVLVQVLLGYLFDPDRAPVGRLEYVVRSSRDESVRQAAVRVLATHSDPAALAALELVATGDASPLVRTEAAVVFAGRTAGPGSTRRVQEALRAEADPGVRAAWINSLGRVPTTAGRDALDALVRSGSEAPAPRREALDTLASVCVRLGDTARIAGLASDSTLPPELRARAAEWMGFLTSPPAQPEAVRE